VRVYECILCAGSSMYLAGMLLLKYIEVMGELGGWKQSWLTTHHGQSQRHIISATYCIKIGTW